jgi:hypothetical protein
MSKIMTALNQGYVREKNLPTIGMICMRIFNERVFLNVRD